MNRGSPTRQPLALMALLAVANSSYAFVVESFDSDPMIAHFEGGGTITAEIVADDTVPSQEAGNNVLSVTYDAVVDYGGVEVAVTDKDWRAEEGVRFYFKGNDDGSNYIIDLRDGGPDSGGAEQWQAVLIDDFSGWHQVTIPFSEFFPNPYYQPCTNDGSVCNNTLDLMTVHAVVFNVPLQSTGSFSVDLVEAVAVDQQDFSADGDGDGVVDLLDACPHTPTDQPVSLAGCPLTANGDDNNSLGAGSPVGWVILLGLGLINRCRRRDR